MRRQIFILKIKVEGREIIFEMFNSRRAVQVNAASFFQKFRYSADISSVDLLINRFVNMLAIDW